MATQTRELEALLDSEMDVDADLTSVEDVRDAVAAYFFENPTRLDIRPLWETNHGCVCRVNFWGHDPASGGLRISRSAFVTVEESRSGLCVRDMTLRRVA